MYKSYIYYLKFTHSIFSYYCFYIFSVGVSVTTYSNKHFKMIQIYISCNQHRLLQVSWYLFLKFIKFKYITNTICLTKTLQSIHVLTFQFCFPNLFPLFRKYIHYITYIMNIEDIIYFFCFNFFYLSYKPFHPLNSSIK